MKRAIIFLFLCTFWAVGTPTRAAAQATHSATLTWVDALNPTTGTTYSVYRATGLCSGTPAFSKIATGITPKTYTDTTVQPGNYCYSVTATFNGVESVQSNTVNPSIPAFAVTNVQVVVI